MKPTLEEYRTSNAKWHGVHLGIPYEIIHWGISDFLPEGTWNSYIYLRSANFVNQEDFEKFNLPLQEYEFGDKKRKYHNYHDLPDYGWHGGLTYYSKTWETDEQGITRTVIKIGDDYAHSFDRDMGYGNGLREVKRNVIRVIEEMAKNISLTQPTQSVDKE